MDLLMEVDERGTARGRVSSRRAREKRKYGRHVGRMGRDGEREGMVMEGWW